MMTLIRKDWRVYRVVVVGSLILSVLPYFIAVAMEWMFSRAPEQEWHNYRAALGVAAGFGVTCSVLLSSVYGAMAFAAERNDRTAEFMALLPVTRAQIALSKLIVAFAGMAPIWALHVGMLNYCNPSEKELWRGLPVLGAMTLVAFGTAWLASTFLKSPTIAVIISMSVTICALIVVAAAADWIVRHWSRTLASEPLALAEVQLRHSAELFGIGLGALSIAVGVMLYKRRVSP